LRMGRCAECVEDQVLAVVGLAGQVAEDAACFRLALSISSIATAPRAVPSPDQAGGQKHDAAFGRGRGSARLPVAPWNAPWKAPCSRSRSERSGSREVLDLGAPVWPASDQARPAPERGSVEKPPAQLRRPASAPGGGGRVDAAPAISRTRASGRLRPCATAPRTGVDVVGDVGSPRGPVPAGPDRGQVSLYFPLFTVVFLDPGQIGAARARMKWMKITRWAPGEGPRLGEMRGRGGM